MESLTPLEMIVNKIDYTINDEITELLKSLENLSTINYVSNEHEHKVKTIES